ncbi:protein Hook homolog 1-like isoform X2 [Brevipalpus obovatus]|uniref:protein Hook homolog 1-like isoform X2 n=1 Tax=Brevipalpus obovatus TaxID=246614 RepID=UPI003D9F3587
MSRITESLFKWLKTLEGVPANLTLEQLCDGFLIAKVLNSLCPEHFNDDWLSKIKRDISSDNWRMKVSNLLKIRDGIIDWYTEVLSQNISSWSELPDVNVVGRENDQEQLGRLLQLVIGIAVQCEAKQDHIRMIMSLEEEVQLGVMEAVQEILTVGREGYQSLVFPDSLNTDQIQILKDQLRKLMDDLTISNEARDQAEQRYFEMEKMVKTYKEEKDALFYENERLNHQLSEYEHKNGNRDGIGSKVHDPSDASLQDRHYDKLQQQMALMENSLYKLDSQKEEFRAKNELLERELMEMRLKNEELQRKSKEARTLKDELDVLRHVSDKAEKLEQTVQVYKSKLEEMVDLKRQMKQTTDQNYQLSKTNLELEEELKRFTAKSQSQLEMYKKQIQDLHQETLAHTHRADQLEFDFKRLSDECDILKEEKEKLSEENSRLKSELRPRSDSNLLADPILKASSNSNQVKFLYDEINRQPGGESAARDKVVKLEHDNQILREKLKNSDDQQVILLQTSLNDAKERIKELENENRHVNRQVIELKSHIKDLSKGKNIKSSSNVPLSSNDENSPSIEQAISRIAELEDILLKKEHEMSETENKYKKYLNKARQVVKNLEPLSLPSSGSTSGSMVFNSLGASGPVPLYDEISPASSNSDLNDLRLVLQMREKQIMELEKELETCKQMKEMEGKLMASAFHDLAARAQRTAVNQRLTATRPPLNTLPQEGSSFLARQRNFAMKRSTMSGEFE